MPKGTKAPSKKPIAIIIGRNIRRLRESKGLTQAQFGQSLGMGERWTKISNWETGKVRAPLRWLERISEVYDIPISELLGESIAAELPEDESELLAYYRIIPDQQDKRRAIGIVRQFVQSGEEFDEQSD